MTGGNEFKTIDFGLDRQRASGTRATLNRTKTQ